VIALRRITSGGTYIPEIDGLRFVAIASVFAFHLGGLLEAQGGPWAGEPSRDDAVRVATLYGSYGVQLFFGISGFVLGLPFAAARLAGGPPVALGAYFLRRLTRLEPPYLIALLVLFAAHALVRGERAGEMAPHLAASAGYAHNLVYGYRSEVMAVAWSLEIEVQFYVLMPLLGLVFAVPHTVARRAVLVGAAFGAVVLQRIVRIEESRLYLSFLGEAQYFLVGLLAADVYVVTWKRSPARSFAWDALALLGAAALVPALAVPGAAPWAMPWVVFALLLGGLASRGVSRCLSTPAIATIGGMCYSIYLFHLELLWLGSRVTFHASVGPPFWANFLVQAVVLGVFVLGASGVFFVLVERPCMRRDWPRRLWRRVTGRGDRAPAPSAGEVPPPSRSR
jgi:peptidoglycan/LPS O-acetylase OafA/YrhL